MTRQQQETESVKRSKGPVPYLPRRMFSVSITVTIVVQPLTLGWSLNSEKENVTDRTFWWPRCHGLVLRQHRVSRVSSLLHRRCFEPPNRLYCAAFVVCFYFGLQALAGRAQLLHLLHVPVVLCAGEPREAVAQGDGQLARADPRNAQAMTIAILPN